MPLHFVKVADLAEDPGGPLLRLAQHEGFMELPSRMRPASGKVDVLMLPGIGPVRPEGIALDRSGEVMRNDVFKAFAPASGVPVVNGVAARAMTGPEVSLGRLALAGGEVFDGRFIDLHIAVGELFRLHRFDDGLEPFGDQGDAIGHGLA